MGFTQVVTDSWRNDELINLWQVKKVLRTSPQPHFPGPPLPPGVHRGAKWLWYTGHLGCKCSAVVKITLMHQMSFLSSIFDVYIDKF